MRPIRRRGRPSRVAIAVAAVGSVGETIAPRTNATGHEMPGMSSCATTATSTIVRSTRPTASSDDRLQVRPELPQRGEEGRAVQERRQDGDEDEVRRQLDRRDPGHEPEREPTDHEQDRVRDADSLGDDDQRCRRDEQEEKDEGCLRRRTFNGG